jgi:ATP phosphoribosyltransferase regulatory subunit
MGLDVGRKWVDRPLGMQDLFPQQAKFRRQVESKLLDNFEHYGFAMVSCGAFEYADTLHRGRAAAEAETWVRVFDTLGRTVALRPEMTPSIARMAAPLLSGGNREIRWCYAERVYHRTDDPASLSWVSGRAAESTQVGVEWIGPSSHDVDARLLMMCQAGMSNLGLQDWQMVVSHGVFAPALLAAKGLNPALVDDLMACLARGDYVGFRRLVDSEGDVDLLDGTALLSSLSDLNPLTSPSNEVFQDWKNPALGTQVEHYWTDLVRFADALKSMGLADKLTFDLTLTRDLSYYTGIVFEVFANGVGAPVALGGRYDGLLAAFGAPAPAVGFTYEVERLMAALTEIDWTGTSSDDSTGATRTLTGTSAKSNDAEGGQPNVNDSVG